MRINPINNQVNNTNFKGIGTKITNMLEGAAATLPEKSSPKRKTISIELHNAMMKLTAYRVAVIFTAMSGFFGYKAADKIANNNAEDFANAIQSADIDTNAPIEVKDVNQDGHADLILQKKDSSKIVLDFRNRNVLMESTGLKSIE